jgi:UDP:flavonoid glycosyltransferase YjiC (YdhE family)
VRAAQFVPYEQLMPRIAVMVTNGGYGGAQFALRHGVPLVVAPGKEDKVEVAARIAWSGAGVNLRTQRPTPARLRRAVARVRHDERFARAAARIGADIAAAPGADGFVRLIDDVIRRHPARDTLTTSSRSPLPATLGRE